MLAGSTEDLDRRSTLTGSVCLDGQPLSAANRRRVRRRVDLIPQAQEHAHACCPHGAVVYALWSVCPA